ncbi:MAG TPA: hypothetical protein VKY34_10080 [Xanthomarina sp.]|nr:hypothetical protein [Xanthomarina sp.]
MEDSVLHIESQCFINKNLNTDTTSLLLKKQPELLVDIKVLIEQIEAKKRCQKKLPTWFETSNIYYPNKLNIEQTSSEITATYKATIISGNSIIDLTGGFGVDCFYFSKHFKTVIHCEINKELSQMVSHNYKQLEVENIQTIASDGLAYLKESTLKFDWIYIDPSRRHDSKGKVFFLKDCLPNVPEHLAVLFEHTNNILIKTSPLLDLSVGLNELKHVKAIHVVAINNEVKELLWILEKEMHSEDIQIETINIKNKDPERFGFKYQDETHAQSEWSLPLSYLYEPNAAILKSGGFHSISEQLQIKKLHQHSHLYTSNELIDFPGRQFKVEYILPFNKKSFKKANIKKANITTRNFPESVDSIRKKLNIKEGGNTYIFATTNLENEKILIVCSKLSRK